jgi:tetratricopeptide (TPR) repeat protein
MARPRLVLALALLAALGLGGALRGGSLTAAGAGPRERAPLSESEIRNLEIAFFEARAARDPAGALDRMRLASLLLQRARASGRETDLERAEAEARASLTRRRAHNASALAVLAGALMAQHRFAEARDAARELVEADSASAGARALYGEVLLELGDYREAHELFSALLHHRHDPAVATRLAAARGEWRDALDYGGRALSQAFDPATLGLLADAHLALGDRAAAAEYERVMDVALAGQPGPFHRAWSLHLLDRGRRVADVLARAEAELRHRRDIYGWDVYAWALYRAGRLPEAAAAMDSALALGTRDPLLLRHAAVMAGARRAFR